MVYFHLLTSLQSNRCIICGLPIATLTSELKAEHLRTYKVLFLHTAELSIHTKEME